MSRSPLADELLARLPELARAAALARMRADVLRARARAWQRVRAASGVLRSPPEGLPKGSRRHTLPPLRAVARRQAAWKSLPYLRREGGQSWAVCPHGLRARRYRTYRRVIVTTWRYRPGAALTAAWPDPPDRRRWGQRRTRSHT